MKRLLLLISIILSSAFPSYGEWAYVPLNQLVQDSDLIIIGELRSVSEYSADGFDYGQGTIMVSEVIWGNVKAGDELTLRWKNQSNIICPRIEHYQNRNRRGIWLLTSDGGRNVRADYPERFAEMRKRAEIENILATEPVSLRASKNAFSTDEPLTLWLVFRNFSDREKQFPAVEFQDGSLLLSPGLSLEVSVTRSSDYKKLGQELQRLRYSDRLPPVKVSPKEEVRVEFDLRPLLKAPLPMGNHPPSMEVSLRGYGTPKRQEIYISNNKGRGADTAAPAQQPYKGPLAQIKGRRYSLKRGFMAFLLALAAYLTFYRLRLGPFGR